MTVNDLDELLFDKYGLHPADLVTALKTLPATHVGSAELPERDAHLLDQAGFTEAPDAYVHVTADTLIQASQLVSTAASGHDVARALGVNGSRVRQRRGERTLWAILNHDIWLFPVLQFEADPRTADRTQQIRGLDRVFPALPSDLHPLAVAGFLRTHHPDLVVDRKLLTPLEWLRTGGDVGPVLRLMEAADWAGV